MNLSGVTIRRFMKSPNPQQKSPRKIAVLGGDGGGAVIGARISRKRVASLLRAARDRGSKREAAGSPAPQISSGTVRIAPHGHSVTHSPQPLQ